jgi:hypothetical protein
MTKVGIAANDEDTAAVSVVVAVDKTVFGRSKCGAAMRRIATAIIPITPTFTRKEFSRVGIVSNIR